MTVGSESKNGGNDIGKWVVRLLFSAVLTIVPLLDIPSLTADDFENVRLRLVNGSSIRADIKSIEQDGSLVGSALLENVMLDEIVEMDPGRAIEKLVMEQKLLPLGGGQIPFEELQFQNETVTVQVMGRPLDLALEIVKAVVWKEDPLVDATIAARSPGSDSVIVQTPRGAQVVRGLVEMVDATHVKVNYDGESRKILLEKVLAIVPAAIQAKPAAGVKAAVHLTDGSILVGAIRQYQNGQLRIALLDSRSIEIPAQSVARMEIQSDRIAWLSDLEPIQVEMQSQFAAARPWQRDRSLLGNPLRLKFSASNKIHVFEKGIGTRSHSALVFANSSAGNSRFNQFRAVVGIDVETAGHGDCEMVVVGDGIQLWSRRVRAGDDPESIVVEIGDINEVALIVRPGEDFDLADHADWANARFIKTD